MIINYLQTIKAFLKSMIDGKRGHIVSVASLAGMLGSPHLSDYCGSKFAAVGIEESIRTELKEDPETQHIQSTVVCPYYIKTGMFDGISGG